MGSRNKAGELDVSQLEERLEREVERAGIKNYVKILLTDSNELRKLGNLTDEDIGLLKRLASKAALPMDFITVIIFGLNKRWSLLQLAFLCYVACVETTQKRKKVFAVEHHISLTVSANEATNVYSTRWKKVSLDCLAVNNLLGGGVPSRGITELYGSSGAGKTQFCLQLAITVQYPEEYGGLASGCVYICTEDRFPSKRLQQLLPQFPRRNFFDPKTLERAADNIFVDHIPDVESLNECLCKRLPILLRNHKIGLVILDSIAALFRSDYTSRQLVQRAKDMRNIGIQLHKLSAANNVAILCVNQVTDSLDTNETLPALGLVWANLVTTKLHAQITPQNGRQLSVVSSPDLPPGSCSYRITPCGIEGL